MKKYALSIIANDQRKIAWQCPPLSFIIFYHSKRTSHYIKNLFRGKNQPDIYDKFCQGENVDFPSLFKDILQKR